MSYINEKYQDLQAFAKSKKEEYKKGDPFPNISFEGLFKEEKLKEVLEEFPDLTKKSDIKFNNPNEVKLTSKGEYRFGPKTKAFMHYLNSQPFLEFLNELTSVEETLMPDPYFEGGGCHQMQKGGFLKIHADFNKQRQTGLDRRLNVLVYLNEDWKDEYGGHFELWDESMSKCIKKVKPSFNTTAIFTTTDFSYHGLPDPLTCPENRTRKSMALYYYTNGRPKEEVNQGLEDHNTLFKARNGADTSMKKHNSQQKIKEVVKSLIPPILLKMVKK